MEIRFGTLDDIPVILDMSETMVAESRFRHYGLNRDKTAAVLTSMIGQPKHATILLAERPSGEIIGMLAGYVVDFFFCDAVIAQDRFFFVKPAARGSSAAIKLLLTFRRWAEARKVRELNINMSVAVEMQRFNKMMNKLGFNCSGSNFSLPLEPSTHAQAAEAKDPT